MELKKVIEQRRSIRKFKPDPVSEEYINEILEAARLAPSGTNVQPWRFVIIKNSEVRRQIEPYTLNFVTRAPVVIACCADFSAFGTVKNRVAELREAEAFVDTNIESYDSSETRKKRLADEEAIKSYLALNTTIAIEHMILRATDLGLGSCWVMMFKQEEVKQVLGLGDQISIVALLPIGYPDQAPKARPRLSMEEIILKEL